MIIIPSIDLYEGKAVRLQQGDYAQMTVYSNDPLIVCYDYAVQGATHLHLVDLEGARDGGTPNLEIVSLLARDSHMQVDVGGGIRDMETVERYLEAGVSRVVLGTAAVQNPDFVKEAAWNFGDAIAVGADIKDGQIAIKGWTETVPETVDEFFARMEDMGVRNIICTDVSKDGMMAGTNLALYEHLAQEFGDRIKIVASGGVSSMDDVLALKKIGIHGAIIGKAYYTGAIKIIDAIKAAAE